MLNFAVEEAIKRFMENYKKKGEERIIIEEYLLPESVKNMYEIAKSKKVFRGLQFNLFDVAYEINLDEFEVGVFNFPFKFMSLDFSSYNKVEEKILTSNNEEAAFFRKLYRVFKLMKEKEDLIYFRREEYKLLSETLKDACEKFELVE